MTSHSDYGDVAKSRNYTGIELIHTFHVNQKISQKCFDILLESLHKSSILRNIIKFGHNLQLKMYEKSLSKSMKTTNLGKAVGGTCTLRQAFMFAFDLKSMFWGIMLRRAKVYNGTKVLSLLFLVSPKRQKFWMTPRKRHKLLIENTNMYSVSDRCDVGGNHPLSLKPFDNADI